MSERTIPRGQFVHPRYAAEAYVGSHYSIDGEYSATLGDYFAAPDSARLGVLYRNAHPYRTTAGRVVYAPRAIKSGATVGDLRRLTIAAEGLVR